MEKYSFEERMQIGRRIYEGELGKVEAARIYGIGVYTARDYLRQYRKTNGLPISSGKKCNWSEQGYSPMFNIKPPEITRVVNVGDRFGHVTVLADEGLDEKSYHRYLVECECGRKISMIKGTLFQNPENLRCRSCATSRANVNRRKILTGKKINGWIVGKETGYHDGYHWYECVCERCGNRSEKNAGQLTYSRSERCAKCMPQYSFVISGDEAEGILPDGTKFWIDAEDIERVNQYWWHISKDGYPTAIIDGHSIKLHRFIIGETDPKVMIDHANRNIYDARKSNLRRADTTQNSANHGLFVTNQTGYTGVYFSNTSQRYEVKVGYKKRRILLGSSKNNLVRLAQMYNIAASFFFGDYAGALNDVPEADEKLTSSVLKRCRYYKEMLDGTPAKAIA